MNKHYFGWFSIVRMGLIQAALGAVVVMTTSTLNRVMVVELALPAMVPGALVAFHYLVQLSRPRMGFGADRGGRMTPFILGGMLSLASGGVLAAFAVGQMHQSFGLGLAIAIAAFFLIGMGVSACGTSLLTLLAKRVQDHRKAAAATTVWVMMIAGFAITAGLAGKLLDPYSPARLLQITAAVSLIAVALTCLALYRLESTSSALAPAGTSGQVTTSAKPKISFRQAFAQVWQESQARRFTVFVFVSMLAYNAQDLILEPFAGVVLGYTPGQSTALSGLQHAGVMCGMLMAAFAGSRFVGKRFGGLRIWVVAGCTLSALALLGLVYVGVTASAAPFKPLVFSLGVANGAFSIAAIASMMSMAGQGQSNREGTRMGLWGAAQAIAFGFGGFAGTIASDAMRYFIGDQGLSYASVFALEALLFLWAAWLAKGTIASIASVKEEPPKAPLGLALKTH